jgi:hypothetical protein
MAALTDEFSEHYNPLQADSGLGDQRRGVPPKQAEAGQPGDARPPSPLRKVGEQAVGVTDVVVADWSSAAPLPTCSLGVDSR